MADIDFEANKQRLGLIQEIGLMAYRFLITLCSGAFIVLLTFVGNIDGSEAFVLDLQKLKCGLYFFLAAISCTFVSMLVAYLSAQSSLLGKKPASKFGIFMHVICLVLPVFLSFGLFLAGAVSAIQGIDAK